VKQGLRLSGGELAIAQALLKDAPSLATRRTDRQPGPTTEHEL